MNENIKDFLTKGPLGKILLISVIVLAGFISWRAVTAVNQNSGYKPARILTPAQQTAQTEHEVSLVKSNPQLSEEAKRGMIGMLRAHEPGNTASNKPPKAP